MDNVYDYRYEMYKDIEQYVSDNEKYIAELLQDKRIHREDKEEYMGVLVDHFFNEDAITGNASGSYFFNTWKSEEAICHNLDLAEEAFEEFGYPQDESKLFNAEYIDVTIRCYLLDQIVAEYVNNELEYLIDLKENY